MNSLSRFLLVILLSMTGSSYAQKVKPQLLVAGPKLGYVTFMEAHVWVMVKPNSAVELKFWETANPKTVYTAASKIKNKDRGICEFICAAEPAKKYSYSLWINGKMVAYDSLTRFETPKLWKWRGDAPDFTIAFGSCNYLNQAEHDRPGKPYGDSTMGIFKKIADKHPNLFLWLGDNIYLREPDWGSETGIYYRYKQFVTDTAIARLFKICPNYAIWDDHDFGPNDANGSFPNKELTLRAFNEFWANPEPALKNNGNATWFEYNDAQFFLLDNRYNRVVDTSSDNYSVLGKEQLEWLKQVLLFSPKNDFKIVCIGGQFLNSSAMFENYANWEKEREEIIKWIDEKKIRNVIFLTGDRHFAELSLLKTPGGINIYDFTASPLTSSNHSPAKTEVNANRVEGTLFDKNRNFGMLQFKTVNGKRQLEFVLFDKSGKEIWRQPFAAN